MGNRLAGRAAIVTGAGRGIGRAVATLLAKEGASVVVNDLGGGVDGTGSSIAPADQVAQEIRDFGGTAVASYDSVAEYESAGSIVQSAMDNFGRLDILCNAAGILRDRMVFNMTEDEWDGVLTVHLYGAFNIVRNAIPHMMRQRYGRTVLFSSISALGSIGQSNYSAAKEGVVGMTRALASELAGCGVTVNAVYPGGSTRMTATVPENIRHVWEWSPSVVGPEEAEDPENNAPKVVYLCTEAAGNITGQVIGTRGWAMSLYSPRHVTKSIHKNGRWTLDELDRLVPISLASELVNPAPPQEQRQ